MNLALVNTVSLLRLEGEVGEFQLELTGNVSDLLNTLLLDDKISQKTDTFGRATDELEFFGCHDESISTAICQLSVTVV